MPFSRTEKLVGSDKFLKIKQACVLIIGLGGVGGYALEAIVRSGVSKVIIVDHDVVSISNLNRQILATYDTIGCPKVEVAKKRIKSINPDCEVITYQSFYNMDTKNEILNHQIDYCIDCFDTVTYKIDLVYECYKRNIKLITCCGTANKFDPSKLEIMRLEKTSVDPLAKVLRNKLKKHPKYHKMMCVCSTEYPKKHTKEDIKDQIRNEVIPPLSNSFVPATAGLLLASYVINDLIK